MKEIINPVMLPNSDWTMPEEFPDLSAYKLISVDLETKDTYIKTKGPGWCFPGARRREDYIVGVAIAADYKSWYFPVRHKQGPNMDPGVVFRWLKPYMEDPSIDKIAFNALYEIGWLSVEGIEMRGTIHDPGIAAALLDEHRRFYNLDSLGGDWLGRKKDQTLLRQAALAFGFGTDDNEVKANLWRLPAMYVGPYAEMDAILNIELYNHVIQRIYSEQLGDVYQLEIDQLKPLYEMRKRGVRVDVAKSKALGKILEGREKAHLDKLTEITGKAIDIWSNKSLSLAYDSLSLPYPRTEKGNASFTGDWLDEQTDPISAMIKECRKLNRARSTFSSGLITDFATEEGRIHCQFHQLKNDEFGTVSGRMSASSPNLTQIPARDPEIGPLVRGLFIPEEGGMWGKFDYSQQEPRLTVHYAFLFGMGGSKEAMEYYRDNPDADYHQMVADMTGLSRKHAKTINLGLAYGMGKEKLRDSLGVDADRAKEIFDQYHSRVPFVKDLSYKCSDVASQRGLIRTILGRRCRFPKWESVDRSINENMGAVDSRDEALLYCKLKTDEAQKALQTWLKEKSWLATPPVPKPTLPKFGVRRAFTYRGMNRLIQGSAADMTKKAMRDVFAAGYVPHVQVHDELAFSVSSKEHCLEIQRIMQDTIKLVVPVRVDCEVGPTWGDTKKLKDFIWQS